MVLSAETRKLILSFPYMREVTNYIVNTQNTRFYKKLNKSCRYNTVIQNLRGSGSGKRCFIVGNGPSLTVEQLEMLRREECFGANRIYKMFEKTQWRPKYYVIQDKYDSTTGVYENLQVENLFVSDVYWKAHGMKHPSAICYHTQRALRQTDEIPFSDDVSKYVQTASTVTYTMIQLAAYMGYGEIYLIGMDHKYANVTNDKGEIIQRNNVRSHAFEDEKPNEVMANIAYMEAAYRSARVFCECKGIKIRNATIGGFLEVYERVNFFDLFCKYSDESKMPKARDTYCIRETVDQI